MICPNCSTKQPDDAEECSVCGQKLKNNGGSEEKESKNKKVHVSLKKKKTESEKTEVKNSENISRKDKKFKLAAAAVCGVLALTAVIVITVALTTNVGLKNTRKLAKKIGGEASKAYSSAKLSDDVIKTSDFEFLNILAKDSTSIIEADKQIAVAGVVMPEWTIFCSTDLSGNLTSVSYYDFAQLKNNMNGCKKKSLIDTTQITKGMNEKEVDKILDMDPYIIQYSSDTVSKTYKYYYKDKQTKSINAYFLSVMFNDNGMVNAPVISEKNDFIQNVLETGM